MECYNVINLIQDLLYKRHFIHTWSCSCFLSPHSKTHFKNIFLLQPDRHYCGHNNLWACWCFSGLIKPSALPGRQLRPSQAALLFFITAAGRLRFLILPSVCWCCHFLCSRCILGVWQLRAAEERNHDIIINIIIICITGLVSCSTLYLTASSAAQLLVSMVMSVMGMM